MIGAGPQLCIKVNLSLKWKQALYFWGTGQSMGSLVQFFICPVGDWSKQGGIMSEMLF